MGELKGGCEALRNLFNKDWDCCSSCHNEDENGYYELSDIELTDGSWFRVCCLVGRSYDLMLDEMELKREEVDE